MSEKEQIPLIDEEEEDVVKTGNPETNMLAKDGYVINPDGSISSEQEAKNDPWDSK